VLPGISTEQLRSRLNRMVADGMLTRKRYREVPPRVDYELTERARELAPILGELARWGYEWAWGPPRPSESVDLGAIFRLIPGLIAPGSTTTGTVALTVSDGRAGEPMAYRITLGRDAVTLTESDEGHADASLSGTAQAWVAVLSPVGDRSGLQTSGNRELAFELLGRFALANSESADIAAGVASA
jgi:HxlR-like helix-turn-helix